MSAVSGPLHVSSLLRTMAIAPPSRDRHHAARQLASLDPRQFLANLQVAAANRSPHAIAALKADMYELNEIFHKLSRAGHDVSAAQRDFQMLQTFVSQISISAASQPEKKHYTSSSSHHQHHRTASVPSSSSTPSHSIMARSRSDPASIEHHYTSTRQGREHQPQSQAPSSSRSAQGPARPAGRSPSSTSSSSSSFSSSTSSSSRNINSTAGVLCPTPHRLIKSRRASAPAVTSASSKKVHFATHATVYTIPSERERGRSASSPTTPTTPSAIASGIVPPPRPSCVPRVADGRSRF